MLTGSPLYRVSRAGSSVGARPAFGAGRGTSRRLSAVAGAQPAQAQRLMLHVGETTIGLPFTREKAQQLDAALQQLLKTFAEKQAAERPRRWDMMEVAFSGGGIDTLEVFCNPNAHTTAFEAKLLLTLQAGGVSVATEGRLSAIKADVDNYLAAATD
ncbi:hypothetical protein Rsub_00270 [Raphidocelis subcapitata]|uniref:Uncharacterized protein n=1 Tax=Raphidocelis subcapitata TaxID=307507 RepID=A0A2V0NKN0_9CHLO|nr:hypothetical protein Rsub_00270 [Raphidocelis subcapitata]|eukprot:GBF87559.1 hypothetical protein Rsub_00270 [Raphidocelis subcapitata]